MNRSGQLIFIPISRTCKNKVRSRNTDHILVRSKYSQIVTAKKISKILSGFEDKYFEEVEGQVYEKGNGMFGIFLGAVIGSFLALLIQLTSTAVFDLNFLFQITFIATIVVCCIIGFFIGSTSSKYENVKIEKIKGSTIVQLRVLDNEGTPIFDALTLNKINEAIK